MSSRRPVIEVHHLSKCYEAYQNPSDRLKEILFSPFSRAGHALIRFLFGGDLQPKPYFQEFWALKEINLQVQPGETLGIIGRNGSGKSTLLQIIAGTLSPTSGTASIKGRVAALLELGSGFNPDFTGRENVLLSGQILGMTRKEILDRFEAIASFADIGDFIDQPVKTYSSGMFVRLAFAVHAHVDASIVIIDEALAVGDIFFRQKCYKRLEDLRQQGAAIILVSHSMPDIEQYCERAIVLHQGRIHFSGNASEAARHYYLLHQPSQASLPQDERPPVTNQFQEACPSMEWAFPTQPKAISESTRQIGTGQAHCLSLTLFDDTGRETSLFRQGDTAVFFYDFILHRVPQGVPVVGILIKNERGIIVHGKNSWQFGSEIPLRWTAGDRLVCRHSVSLTLAPGEYVYEVGLSMVPFTLWANRDRISHEEMSAAEHRICHLPEAGVFSIAIAQKNLVGQLTHHGITNLPGELRVARIDNNPNATITFPDLSDVSL